MGSDCRKIARKDRQRRKKLLLLGCQKSLHQGQHVPRQAKKSEGVQKYQGILDRLPQQIDGSGRWQLQQED